MQIEIDQSQDPVTVVLTGRLDILGAETIALPLATLSGSADSIVVDLSGVSFIASIGLRHLVTTAKKLNRRGGRLLLRNPNAAVIEVIETSGLSALLPIMDVGSSA
jgi:anti-anti-sigma factor